MRLTTEFAGEDLYRVPGAGLITVEPNGAPEDSPKAAVETVGTNDPNAMRSVVAVTMPSTVYIHVTNFPGWTATIDRRDLPLYNWGGTMLAASVPPGRHVIVVHYEPEAFKIGVVLAVAAALILAGAVAWSLKRSRSRTDDTGTTLLGAGMSRLLAP